MKLKAVMIYSFADKEIPFLFKNAFNYLPPFCEFIHIKARNIPCFLLYGIVLTRQDFSIYSLIRVVVAFHVVIRYNLNDNHYQFCNCI